MYVIAFVYDHFKRTWVILSFQLSYNSALYHIFIASSTCMMFIVETCDNEYVDVVLDYTVCQMEMKETVTWRCCVIGSFIVIDNKRKRLSDCATYPFVGGISGEEGRCADFSDTLSGS